MSYQIIQISDEDFLQIGKLITDRYGIKLPSKKKILFQSRLQSRLRDLQFDSFEKYCQFILDPANTIKELTKVIDYISTNKTEFFRENQHFDYLTSKILPELFREANFKQNQYLNCWSAGCSSGQEAFSLAMVLEDYKRSRQLEFDFSVLGTDVSSKVLQIAQKATYPFAQSIQIPKEFLKQFVLKSKDQENPRIKIVNSIRSKVNFTYGNLMDDHYQINQRFKLIFIRNTLIYFNQDDQKQILKKLLSYLETGGYLFIGHSESLINLNLSIQIIAPSLYQKV